MYWDYIIVGAGSAGCVLANRLSADPDKKVLLIEAGGSDRNPLQRIPVVGSLLNFGNKKSDWNYQTCPDNSRSHRTEMWSRGKLIGGSSSLNGMIYVRGAREDFNHWADMGNDGWSYKDVLPHFKKIEQHELSRSDNPSSDYYGSEGLLKIRQMQGAHPLSQAFVSACTEFGIPANPDYNAADQLGASILSMTQSKRIRYSSAQAFLQPAKRRPNLRVLKNTLVTKILLKEKNAIGVSVAINGRSEISDIFGGQVILSGGAINSPQLLMLSGIGPAKHLQALNIPVQQDLPGVGQNLQDHCCFQLHAKVNVSTLNTAKFSLFKAVFDWLISGKGPLTSSGYQALAFIKTHADLNNPDVQIHMMPGAAIKDENNALKMLDYPCITLLPNISHPKSRGELKLVTNSPYDYPAIYPNMLSSEEDLLPLIAAGRLCRKLLQTKALQPYIVQETLPGLDVQTDQEWVEFIRENAATSYHHSGTCKMGTDRMAVVDPKLKVRGIENLRVIDGSIMPTITSGNTNAACMMIGEKGANMILQENG